MSAATDGFTHRQVTVGGGGLHVVEAGDPGGQPFVFLHGWPESWRCWQQIMSLAAGRARVIAVDLPGVPPWEEFLRAPFLWHFALHAVPGLPERLVQDRQQDYFAYFYTALAADPAAVTQEARRAYEAAYGSDEALAAGFGWFRAFSRDAEDNRQSALGPSVTTPLLYLRGERERGGDIGAYADGLRGAGVPNVTQSVVPGAGHFTQEEAPEETWRQIAGFAGL